MGQQRQYVGIDLHRRRSVIVRRSGEGETLDTVRIDNDPLALAAEVAKAGQGPEVVLEATLGWYWAADVLAECGAMVHLAHPLGNNWGHRRVKNDERDATDLVDLLRLGRLSEAWVAPPAARELRELVRYRAKLVQLRSGLKAQVHSVLAKEGVRVEVSDLFGVAGTELLDSCELADAYAVRVESLRDILEVIEREIAMLARRIDDWLADDAGYRAIQALPVVGPVLAAVFVAEIGDVGRFASARHLCSWAGLTPVHRESDTTVHRGHTPVVRTQSPPARRSTPKGAGLRPVALDKRGSFRDDASPHSASVRGEAVAGWCRGPIGQLVRGRRASRPAGSRRQRPVAPLCALVMYRSTH